MKASSIRFRSPPVLAGPGFITQNYDSNSIYVGNSFLGIDKLIWIHGRHTFKFGGEIRRI